MQAPIFCWVQRLPFIIPTFLMNLKLHIEVYLFDFH